ncbi:hypothetical protein VCHA38P215_10350 [Vibrio chagasii]|nr:hypothetical protein VCHA38P215_10350 [Vibrio chagasii]CAH7087131.1 hypothetical protein VCHA48P434_10354 [Vibrio chagasii]
MFCLSLLFSTHYEIYLRQEVLAVTTQMHNNLFKSDSQRVAFSPCVDFSV